MTLKKGSEMKKITVSEIGISGFRRWLSGCGFPIVVVFAISNWRKLGSCASMKRVVGELSQSYEQGGLVEFIEDERSDLCVELYVEDAPTVVVFRNGKEIDRFIDPSSEARIKQTLSMATDPARHHFPHPAMKPAGTVKE